MAKKHAHRPSSPGYVELDAAAAKVAPVLLAGDALAPVRALYDAYTEAQAAVTACHDAMEDALAAPSARNAAIAAAVQAGKKPPAAMSDAEARARADVARANLDSALNAAYRTATAYEQSLRQHRLVIREALLPSFRDLDAAAIQAMRKAEAATAKRDIVLSALDAVDHFAARAEDAAQAERTRRFETAYFDARARLLAEYRHGGEGRAALGALTDFPGELVVRDLFEEAEFLAARKGESYVRELRDTEAELRAWRNGERTATFEVKRRRIADLEARLEGLRDR